MPSLLVDALVWNYVGKAGVLPGFLAWLGTDLVTLTEVIEQLRPALGAWPELIAVMEAQGTGEIQAVEPDRDEEALRLEFLIRWPGLGPVDCGLLAVAQQRSWTLLTCDRTLLNKAKQIGVVTADLTSLLDQGVNLGYMSKDDRLWVTSFSTGHAGRRNDSPA